MEIRPTARDSRDSNALTRIKQAIGVGGGIGLALAGASQGQAAIQVSTNGFTVLDNGTVTWDIDGDAETDITLLDDTINMCGNPTNNGFYVLESTGTGGFNYTTPFSNQLEPIGDATTVGAGDAFSNLDCATHDNPCNALGSTSQDFDLFPGADTGNDFSGRIGFRFDNNGTTNYGVAHFSIIGMDGIDPLGTFRINSWAYEDTGASILGGALSGVVPEPMSVATWAGITALAMGAVGIRRRRGEAC